MSKQIYKIPVVWQMYAVLEVESDSLENAISHVESADTPLPTNGSYISDSFEVDFDAIPVHNP